MTQAKNEQALLELWEDEGFRAATSGNEQKLADYFDELSEKLTTEQARVVRTGIEQRLKDLDPSWSRVRQNDRRGR